MILVPERTTCTRSTVSLPVRMPSRACTRTWLLVTVPVSGRSTYVFCLSFRRLEAKIGVDTDLASGRGREDGRHPSSIHQATACAQAPLPSSPPCRKDPLYFRGHPPHHFLNNGIGLAFVVFMLFHMLSACNMIPWLL